MRLTPRDWNHLGSSVGELWRAVPDEPWHHRVGEVESIFLAPTQEAIDDVGRSDAAIQSLQRDINMAVSTSDPATVTGQGVFQLQVEYMGFDARWMNFRSAFDAREFSAVLGNADEIKKFDVEYQNFRSRLEGLGFRPSSSLGELPVTQGGQDRTVTDELLGYVPWLAAGAALWLLAPYVIPIATGLFAAKAVS